jgi:unsaturated chondroitin disaccharide hydrolase
MMKIDHSLNAEDLQTRLDKCWERSGEKILRIDQQYDHESGSPVCTVNGKYTTRGWTDWTQGFEYGSAILQYDATGEKEFLDIGRTNTLENMAGHISHIGVHDHGFNNISTFGNLLRLMKESKIDHDDWEQSFYELALKISGAVQASRWSPVTGGGFIYSFNGPHSLFVDTIRSCRILAVSHLLGHYLQAEQDEPVSLLGRMIDHARATASYSIYYGDGRDSYDVSGRTAHESIFNMNNGEYRCPNTQQGYSPFSTWTRGLAWAMLGFAEELELIREIPDDELQLFGNCEEIEGMFIKAVLATCNFYIENTPIDGIPYWDTGAPALLMMGDYLTKKADPFNAFEPVDSSAAAIAAQGLLRSGRILQTIDQEEAGRFWQAGLTVVNTLLDEPYMSTGTDHQGLLLHSIYHRPNGWDHVPEGSQIPYGESSMWGDYHMREVALYLCKILKGEPYYRFFNCI